MNHRGTDPDPQRPIRTSPPAVVWFFLLVVLTFDGVLGWMVYQQLRIARFPTTPAVVEDTAVEPEFSSTSSALLRCPRITFRYTVAGTPYTSDRFRHGGYCSSDALDVDRVLREVHEGGNLTAHYNPERPQEAYLTAGMGPIEHTALLVFLPFNVFALGWILEIVSLVLTGRRLEPDEVRFGTEGRRLWARFPRLGPIKFALGILLVASFPIALAVVFLFDLLPRGIFPPVWLGLGLLTLGVFVGKGVWNRWHPSVAVFDPGTGRLVLPDGTALRRDQIVDWEVEEERSPTGKFSRFHSRLSYRDDGGATHRAAFPALPSREAAYRFSDWLVETLGLES